MEKQDPRAENPNDRPPKSPLRLYDIYEGGRADVQKYIRKLARPPPPPHVLQGITSFGAGSQSPLVFIATQLIQSIFFRKSGK